WPGTSLKKSSSSSRLTYALADGSRYPFPVPDFWRPNMIEGVGIRPLLQIPDERGKVMRMLRATDPDFKEFGEVYFSVVFPGAIKGWHLHKRMTINYAVPFGRIKLVLFDDRPSSPTRGEIQEFF